MEYSPINFRRMDWFRYNPRLQYPWRDIQRGLGDHQAALVRHCHQGELPRTDYTEPRSYLSYFLE